MHNQSILSSRTQINHCREVCIREKNTQRAVSFPLSYTTTAGNISCIVAQALESEKEVTIEISGVKVSNEMNIGNFNDRGLEKVTFQVTDIKNSYAKAKNVGVLHLDVSQKNLTQPASSSRSYTPQSDLNSAVSKRPESLAASIPIIHEEKDEIERYLKCRGYLYNIEECGKVYLKQIGISKNISIFEESIAIPAGSWTIYMIKKQVYHFVASLVKDPSYGDIATKLGGLLRKRVGVISPITTEKTFNLLFPNTFTKTPPTFILRRSKDEQIVPRSAKTNHNFKNSCMTTSSVTPSNESIRIPSNSYAMYLLEGYSEHFIRYYEKDPSHKELTNDLEQLFSLKEVKFSLIKSEESLNVPLSNSNSIFDKIVVVHNKKPQVIMNLSQTERFNNKKDLI